MVSDSVITNGDTLKGELEAELSFYYHKLNVLILGNIFSPGQHVYSD